MAADGGANLRICTTGAIGFTYRVALLTGLLTISTVAPATDLIGVKTAFFASPTGLVIRPQPLKQIAEKINLIITKTSLLMKLTSNKQLAFAIKKEFFQLSDQHEISA